MLLCREEFQAHGLSELVTIQCRDVGQDGFGLKDIADAGIHNDTQPTTPPPHHSSVPRHAESMGCYRQC